MGIGRMVGRWIFRMGGWLAGLLAWLAGFEGKKGGRNGRVRDKAGTYIILREGVWRGGNGSDGNGDDGSGGLPFFTSSVPSFSYVLSH